MIYFIQAGAVISVTGLVYCKSSLPIRRFEFRYSKCAQQAFIYGGTITCGRMKVYCKSSPPIREKMRREKGREKEQRI